MAEDMVEVTKIEFECFSFPYPPAVINFLFEYFGNFFFVVEEGGLMGYIVGVSKKNEGHLVSLAVRHVFRRRKIGSLLLERLCQKLIEDDKEKIVLEVRASNKAAQSFYKNHGFKIKKIINQYYENLEDAYYMEKVLERTPLQNDVV